ncbi:Toxoplasma gondii family B protein [Toxoplasma gondii VAND]|uniref:Toxoplasma gondii family B protein n=1 Tax=Toxoplasma gondii VAND TaxID=933077 RepID=A0A086Q685_TOXGO|nr:Toxoplasma gondii family B protein [Toxoplasma gondii VAND]
MNPPSAASLTSFTIFIVGQAHSVNSLTMATHVLDQTPTIHSRTNVAVATFRASTATTPTEEGQKRRQAGVLLKKSKRNSPPKKTTVALRRTYKKNAVTLIFTLTAALVLLLVSVKLQQCRRRLLRKTSGEIAGSTSRRLAEGGHEDNCTREVRAQTVGSEEFVVRRLMRFRCSGGCGRSTGRELSVCAEDYKAQVLEAIVEAGTLTGYWIRKASRTEGQPACVTCTKCPFSNQCLRHKPSGGIHCVCLEASGACVCRDRHSGEVP